MNKLFEIWQTAEKASAIALDNVGRQPYSVLGVVVVNDDPESQRRIKVALSSAPQFQSDWLRRIYDSPFVDAPLPPIGSTVLCIWVDGLDTNGYYLQVSNQTNPPLDKSDVVKDYAAELPGNRKVSVAEEDNVTAGGDISLEAGKDVVMSAAQDIQANSERDILYSSLRALVLEAALYLRLKAGTNVIQLGADGSTVVEGNWSIDLGGATINFVNAGTFTINGKQVAVVGAVDSRGDALVTPGW